MVAAFPGEQMTTQIPDTVRYAENDWRLAGVNGTGLFEPLAHGLRPKSALSACWRGYYCNYALLEHTLELERLEIVAHDGPLPNVYGRAPSTSKSPFFAASYASIGQPIEFTGGMLIARGFLKELHVNMGFHPAWKYTDVVEAKFEAGRLTSLTDCSDAMAQVRARLKQLSLRPAMTSSQEEIAAWIERTFSLKY
jgi:hypothetical protein